jgi:hypothetical protein
VLRLVSITPHLPAIGIRGKTMADFVSLNRILHFVLFILACIDTHKWRKARKAHRNQSTRALDHQDFVRSEIDDLAMPAPIHDDHGLGKDIEMSPTSPVAREFV